MEDRQCGSGRVSPSLASLRSTKTLIDALKSVSEPGVSADRVRVLLSVYRRLDNRSEGLADDSPRALELHDRRKEALHEALTAEGWDVQDWGTTDDARPHELVELVVAIATNPQLQTAVLSASGWVAIEVVKASIGTMAAEAVKALLARLLPKQREHKILDFTITLAGGTIIQVQPNSEVSVAGHQGS